MPAAASNSLSLDAWRAEQRRWDLNRRFTLTTCGDAVAFLGEVCRLALETGQAPTFRLRDNQVLVVNRCDQGWTSQLFASGLDQLAARYGARSNP
jgi:pterin-4a-carbinolamine dehydratase